MYCSMGLKLFPLSKNQKIEELTKLLVRRGEEIANLNMRWREKHNQTEAEKQNLALRLQMLQP